ncbi:MAG: AAA family ATPase [Acidobacteria bacterium]|nr:AAA family ATPase [Acidobacteriota bacterium]
MVAVLCRFDRDFHQALRNGSGVATEEGARMLTRLRVENFRSIEKCEVDFRPVTIFFGPTSAGKSTLLYALFVLRNFILNPNQAVDGLFNLGFQNLGGFDACVFNHSASKTVGIFADFGDVGGYGVGLRKTDADITAETRLLNMTAKVAIPYGANQSFSFNYDLDKEGFTINWNGFASTVSSRTGTTEGQALTTRLAEQLNSPVEQIKRVDVCPHRRGFHKPSYSPAPLTPTPTSEDEVATLIINDQNAPPRISINTVEIFDRDFRTFTPPGTATTFLQTTEQTGARVPGLLVNDGFGVNQVVYMLAKIHRPDSQTILIEEPEVHLHPTVIRRFARVIARLASEEDKQLVFTTHSEQFLLSILACVKEQLLAPEHLRCYHVARQGKQTIFTNEPVSEKGQITGGLSSFMAGELEDIKTFLSAAD